MKWNERRIFLENENFINTLINHFFFSGNFMFQEKFLSSSKGDLISSAIGNLANQFLHCLSPRASSHASDNFFYEACTTFRVVQQNTTNVSPLDLSFWNRRWTNNRRRDRSFSLSETSLRQSGHQTARRVRCSTWSFQILHFKTPTHAHLLEENAITLWPT